MTLLSRSASHSSSILNRPSVFSAGLEFSQSQVEMDGILGHFSKEAGNLSNLLAMASGSLVYRAARSGLLSAGVFKSFASLAALSSEVTAFRGATNLFSTLRGEPVHESVFDLKGWASTFVSFVSLKGAGRVAEGQNGVLAHALQSSSMVAANQLSSSLGFTNAPQGTLLEQLLHAESMNLAMSGGSALLGMATGGRLQALEQGFEIRARAIEATPLRSRSQRGSSSFLLGPQIAVAQGPSEASLEEPSPPHIMMAVASEVRGSGSIPADWPSSIPASWAQIAGSHLYTAREVKNTQDLSEAIVHDGILRLLGREAVHSIFGYGSFPYFRDGVLQDIRLWDADKKPDFVVVGHASQMVENIARLWNLNEAQKAELQNHARYNRQGLREGFAFFNTDILVPGRGPVGFKISFIDEAAFFARTRDQKAVLEYSQIRLKDAAASNLIWSRDRETTLEHLERIRDEFYERAYGRLVSPLLGGLRHFFQFETTGADLARSFFIYSYRVEGYRFWENGSNSWDKGSKLYRERGELSRPLLLGAFRRFLESHSGSIRVYYKGAEISSQEVSAENMYEVSLLDRGFNRGSLARRVRSIMGLPAYLWLNIRGLFSYLAHGVPSNRLSHAYYVQSSEEYAGRKGRNLTFKPGMTEPPMLARILAHPWSKKLPGLKKIALDSLYYPVYYSNLAPYVNELYAAGRSSLLYLSETEYDAMLGWLSASPALTQTRDVALLEELAALMAQTQNSALQSASAKIIRHIEKLPLLEPALLAFIRKHQVKIDQLIAATSHRAP